MIRNYFKVALRNLLKRKGYSIINILGLATGMAVCLLIVLYVQGELGYDKHHEKADRIYRVALERIYPGRSTSYSMIPHSVGTAIKKDFPEVSECVRLLNFVGNGNFVYRVGDKIYEDNNVLGADSNFFKVFSSEFIEGNASSALMQLNSVVLSETTARKVFGSVSNAIGKQFLVDGFNPDNAPFLITAVTKDWPQNTHFEYDMLISTVSAPFLAQPNYAGFNAHTYLLLQPNASPKGLESKLPQIVEKYVSGDITRNFGQSYEDFTKAGNGYRYFLQPLKDIHLHSNLEAELKPNGSIKSVYVFSVIAIFILFLACINFINLCTARSVERAKEVGIRKTFGSEKKGLVVQFLLESVLISLFAIVVALVLILLSLPLFNQMSGKSLTMLYFLQPLNLLLILLFAIGVGLAAGAYPALILSSYKPIMVLKGRFKSNKYGLLLRNGLVIFQFSISVILIIATIIVNQQMNYMLGDKVGFRKDHIITLERTDLLQQQTTAFKTEIERIPGVQFASGASSMPGNENFFGSTFQKVNSNESVTGRGIIVDEDFAKLLELQLVQGRFFSEQFATDSLSIVLNEKAVKELGLPSDPIGARLTTPDGFLNAPDSTVYQYTVTGVVKNFHFQSLHQPIAPLYFVNSSRFQNVNGLMAIRVNGKDLQSTLSQIEATWKKFVKDQPFRYNFLDQTLASQYQAEVAAQRIFTAFSSLAIFIACIGLLGLVAYTTQQRIREIGIRKVLGASAANIIQMLSKDLLKLVLIASFIAFPIAWFGINRWLQDFAYRVDVNWMVFIGAALISLLIAFVTISVQSVRAALMNPVKSLKTE